jgi:hypothetical protein
MVCAINIDHEPAGSHETALKKFLSVSELALARMAATYMLGPFRLDAETDTLIRGGEPGAPVGENARREAERSTNAGCQLLLAVHLLTGNRRRSHGEPPIWLIRVWRDEPR